MVELLNKYVQVHVWCFIEGLFQENLYSDRYFVLLLRGVLLNHINLQGMGAGLHTLISTALFCRLLQSPEFQML